MRKKVTFPIILIVSVILLYGVYRTFFINFQGQDLSAPVLEGPEEISWELGREFVFSPAKHGITAKDDQDGDVSAKITYEGTVDVHTEGSYDVRYHVSDKAGNQSEHVLNVHVKKTSVVSSRQLMYADPHTIIPEIVDPDSMTVLVNKQHAIPDGWAPNDLVPITSNSERDMYLRSEAAAAWERLNQAALERGLHIWVVSSYRTAAYQESLFNGYYASNGEAAYLFSALPRRSEHELGLAVDVSYDGFLHEDLLNSEVGRFMKEEGYKYGFVLRYPSGKEAVTGYAFEAWHYRYVGPTLAKELTQKNIVLEEY